MSDILLWSGIVLLAVSAAAGIITAIILLASKRRLEARLNNEYGKKK